MDKRIRVVAVFSVLCFLLLFLQLNNLQVKKASALVRNPLEPGTSISSDSEVPRGDIILPSGAVLAYSTKTSAGYVRHYTNGPLYADITGAFDAVYQSNLSGIESYYNSYLVEHTSSVEHLDDLLTQKTGTDTVEVTISPHVQAIAAAALAPYAAGAVVAINPTTGAILALYSKPSYDPNELSSLNRKSVIDYYNSLDPSSGSSPLVNGATYTRIAPGSTFKVVTTSAIFDHDPKLETENVPLESSIPVPQSNLLLHNFKSEACGGMLAENLWKSCDTAYGHYGLELGGTKLAEEADAFGFNKQPPIDLPSSEVSPAVFPAAASFPTNLPSLAYSAIGQENVAETVLQDALVASAIANGGEIMAPHLMAHIINDQGQLVTTYEPHVWLKATSIQTADEVRALMLGVPLYGTAAGVFPPSLDVAAKTGTAEVGINECSSDWMIATGPADAGDVPKVAVAVVLPYQPGLACDGTGAEYAGPIAAKVLEAAVGYHA